MSEPSTSMQVLAMIGPARMLAALIARGVLLCAPDATALQPSLDITQYAHTA
jgi:hypothetical protein